MSQTRSLKNVTKYWQSHWNYHFFAPNLTKQRKVGRGRKGEKICCKPLHNEAVKA